MKQFIQKMALVALMLTLVTACQKEEVVNMQTDDQITLRTLAFDLETLQDIHDALFAEINELGADGTLTLQQKNYLINLLKKMQKAIDRGDEEEANLILEDEFLDYLETLLDGGVIDQDQFDGLEGIATNQTDPSTGTVTYTAPNGDAHSYEWKVMADGKKWLVQNLRHETEGYTSLHYPESEYPGGIIPGSDLFGRMYTIDAASAACASLGGGWHLPANDDWLDLGRAYATVDGIDPWTQYEFFAPDIYHYGSVGIGPNAVYGYLVANMYNWNNSGLNVGFDALLGGISTPGGYDILGVAGLYASSTTKYFYYTNEEGQQVQGTANYYFNMSLQREDGQPVVGLAPVEPSNGLSYSCRCVHD